MDSTSHQGRDVETDIPTEGLEDTEKPSVTEEILNEAGHRESRHYKRLTKQERLSRSPEAFSSAKAVEFVSVGEDSRQRTSQSGYYRWITGLGKRNMPKAHSADDCETREPSGAGPELDPKPFFQCERCQQRKDSSEGLAQALQQIKHLQEEKEILNRQNLLLKESLSELSKPAGLVEMVKNRSFQQNQDLLRENDRLKDSLISAQEANERLRNAASNFQLAMDNREFLGPQATDDQISSIYKTLLQRVKIWTQNISKGNDFSFDHITPELLFKIRRVAPRCVEVSNYQDLLNSERRIRMFARGWIWLVMYNTLFPSLHSVDNLEPVYDQWLDRGLSGAVYLLEKRLYFADKDRKFVSHRELNDWRAFTTELFSRLENPKQSKHIQESVERQCREIIEILGPWAPQHTTKELFDSLAPIVANAINFSQLLRRQRACWGVCYPAQPKALNNDIHGVLFDANSMEDADDDGDEEDDTGEDIGKFVEIVGSPSLIKRGDAEGRHFEEQMCICCAIVSCGEYRI